MTKIHQSEHLFFEKHYQQSYGNKLEKFNEIRLTPNKMTYQN